MKLECTARVTAIGSSRAVGIAHAGVIHVNPNLITHVEEKDKSMHILGDKNDCYDAYYNLTDESFAKVVTWMEAHRGVRLECMARVTAVCSDRAVSRAQGGVIYVNPSLITHIEENDKSVHILDEKDDYTDAYYTLTDESFAKVAAWMEVYE